MALRNQELGKISKIFQDAHRECEAKRAAATQVVALKITYEEPGPDGSFEILFMTWEEADEYRKHWVSEGRWATSKDVIEEASFEEGVRLCKDKDCIAGEYPLQEARRFQELNSVVKALDLDI